MALYCTLSLPLLRYSSIFSLSHSLIVHFVKILCFSFFFGRYFSFFYFQKFRSLTFYFTVDEPRQEDWFEVERLHDISFPIKYLFFLQLSLSLLSLLSLFSLSFPSLTLLSLLSTFLSSFRHFSSTHSFLFHFPFSLQDMRQSSLTRFAIRNVWKSYIC